MHEGQRTAAQALRPLLSDTDAPGIWRDDGDIVEMTIETIANIVDQYRHGNQMIHRSVKEALGLGRVQIDAHHAIGAGSTQQIEDETAGDGFAATMLLVLTGIAEQWAYSGDRPG